MSPRKRSQVEVIGTRESRVLAGTLGREMRATRRQRGLTQAELGAKVGLSHARIGELERGEGDTAQIGTWIKVGFALGRPLATAFSREIRNPEPVDAGHLAAQELLLRLARKARRTSTFELPTRLASPGVSIDIGIRDDPARVLVLAEVWNRSDDLGRAARHEDRKIAEASAVGVLLGGDNPPYRVAACWALVD